MYDSVEVDDTLVYFNAFVLHFVTVIISEYYLVVLTVAWQK
jgi:hypothetical protein